MTYDHLKEHVDAIAREFKVETEKVWHFIIDDMRRILVYKNIGDNKEMIAAAMINAPVSQSLYEKPAIQVADD